jgi:uncharacterized protein YjiS (DUF1127 family)
MRQRPETEMEIHAAKVLNHNDLHETSWRATMLARAALLALSDETITDQTDVHAQAMLEHLWTLGFRPRS